MAKVKKADDNKADDNYSQRVRQDLRNMIIQTVGKSEKAEDGVLTRQRVPEDPFEQLYSSQNLLLPPYDFDNLYSIYEENDVLQACVAAMRNNVDGFGYDLDFVGDDFKEKKTPEAKAEYESLKNFFDYANDEQSWTTIRKDAREDLEVIGNAAIEIVRNLKGEIALAYHLPFKRMRIAAIKTGQEDGVRTKVVVFRNGKPTTLTVRKLFRRFCQLSPSGKKLRWFKSFGDPRPMDATDGLFKSPVEIKRFATEVMHFKLNFGGNVYGFPRWIGAVLEAMGRRSAQFVNYDLFESQGLPPMAIMVSNGILTDDSVSAIQEMVRGLRGVEKWNRVVLLESHVESSGLEDKGQAKIELKNLAEYRKEDQMFERYLTSTAHNTRHSFRLPPLYVGMTETYTMATSKAAKTVAEEQIFVPEREAVDEIINQRIVVKEFNAKYWRYRTRGPRIVGAEEISKGVETFSKVGAFSVNHAIEMANEAFGLNMTKYEGKWADYPLEFVIKLVEQGATVEGLDELADMAGGLAPEVKQLLPPPGQQQLPVPITQKGLPAYVPQKILNSEMFDEDEKALYKKLLMIQDVITDLKETEYDGEPDSEDTE